MLPLTGDVPVDPVVAGGGESVSADGEVATGESVSGIAPPDDPPTVIVGVAPSASNADDAGPELLRLPTNAAVAAPPITVDRMMSFLFEDFTL